jgi:tRNA threonylcarbamoyladenosine biosynthesis protein TsaB
MDQSGTYYHLAIETATEVCSVALGDKSELVAEDNIYRKNSHTETLTLQIEKVLRESGIEYSDLKGVTVSGGPGSYTGLRVGTSVAKGICYACDIPLVSVSTLYGLGKGVANRVKEGQVILPMIDARRQEVYIAHYDHQMNEIKPVYNLILKEGVFRNLKTDKALICGNGAFKCEGLDLGVPSEIIDTSCKAADLLEESFNRLTQGKIEDIAYYNPYYHKAPNVTKSKKNILG